MVKSIIFHFFLHREKLQCNVMVDIQNTHLPFKVEFLNVMGEIQNSMNFMNKVVKFVKSTVKFLKAS